MIQPNTTLQEAEGKMDEINVGVIPVCTGERLDGVLTDRDIVVRATAAGRDPKTTRVRDAMTRDVVSVFEDQDVQDAARLMEEQQVRRLVVLSRDKRLVGIVSLGDLATEGDDRLAAEILGGVSEPAEPDR